jgi:hypothetical protein
LMVAEPLPGAADCCAVTDPACPLLPDNGSCMARLDPGAAPADGNCAQAEMQAQARTVSGRVICLIGTP